MKLFQNCTRGLGGVVIMSPSCLPPGRVGRHCFSPCVRRLSVTKLCTLYNLKTVRDISTKLHTLVKHIQTRCHAQEPELCFGYFWSYFPLIVCNDILCPFYNLITIRGISTKLHTLVKHIKLTCHAQKP